LIIATVLILIFLAYIYISTSIRYHHEKEPILLLCQEYLDFFANPMPETLINYTDEQLKDYLDHYWSNINNKYADIFSPDVAATVKALEMEQSVLNQIANRQLLITAETYLIDRVIQLKVGKGRATVIFHVTWNYTDMVFQKDSAIWQTGKHTGETYYKLALVKSNHQWLVQNVAWNPFVASFGW